MKQTLDHLRSSKPKARPERSVTLCLAPDLVGDVQALVEERSALMQSRAIQDDPEAGGKPRRAGQGVCKREREINTELAALFEKIVEHEGEMRLRATWTDGEWRRWVDAHPPREEGTSGHEFDQRAAHGICHGADLIEELGAFAFEWNGEKMAPGDWDDIFAPVVGGGDKATMAQAIVGMYESRLDFQQWRSSLSATLSRLNAFDSAQTSPSPNADSTAGSPDSSTAATTEKETK